MRSRPSATRLAPRSAWLRCALLLSMLPAFAWPSLAQVVGDDPGSGPEAIAYGPMRQVATLADRRITESSGLAASQRHPGQFWTHNDSGGGARLFRIDAAGQTVASLDLPLPRPTDWEDLACFTWKGRPLLLIGDVGDNRAERPFVTLWLLAEEDWGAGQHRADAAPLRLDIQYADGPRDCESVAFDPVRGEVLLLTKVDPRRDFFAHAAAYVFDLAEALARLRDAREQGGQGGGGEEAGGGEPAPLVVPRAADLPLKIAVAADVSPDGRRCAVATYGHAYVFTRGPDEGWAAALSRPARTVRLGARGQSETLAYDPDGRTLWLTAEGRGRPLWRVDPIVPPPR